MAAQAFKGRVAGGVWEKLFSLLIAASLNEGTTIANNSTRYGKPYIIWIAIYLTVLQPYQHTFLGRSNRP